MVYNSEYTDEKIIKIDCNCGCGQEIKLSKDMITDEKTFYYLSLNTSQFYAKQNGVFRTIGHRLKTAFRIIMGKEYRLTEVVLNEEDMKKLKELIFEM